MVFAGVLVAVAFSGAKTQKLEYTHGALWLSGFTRAYVLGMSRLAYQVLMRCGILHPHLNEIGKELRYYLEF